MTITARHCNLPNMPSQASHTAPLTLDEAIRADALDCVMCGICVPHCPTFALSENEADGPRGRISLLLGISDGGLPVDASVRDHLDGCLTCRACESVCPSGVAYGRLIDAGRARLARGDEAALRPRALGRHWRWLRDVLLTRRRRLGIAWGLYRVTMTLGAGRLTRRLAGVIGQSLPRRPLGLPRGLPQSQATVSNHGAERGTVGLFVGCTGQAMNATAARAARDVLTALGYRVITPPAQTCCGAMHAHGGDPEGARNQRERNAATFREAGLDEVVVIGTACRSELAGLEAEHGLRVREITEWLLEREPTEWPSIPALDWRIAIHTPCSQRNHLKQPDAARQLLERIPGLELLDIADNQRCCGAAGMQVMLYPRQADELRAPKLESIENLQPDMVVSANVGCATHLAAGAELTMAQPVEVIAAALAQRRD